MQRMRGIAAGDDRARLVPQALRQRERRVGARGIVLAAGEDRAERRIETRGKHQSEHELRGIVERSPARNPVPAAGLVDQARPWLAHQPLVQVAAATSLAKKRRLSSA